MLRKIIAIGALVVLPTVLIGLVLGWLSGDWHIVFFVWPGVLLFATVFALTFRGIIALLDWAFD